MNANNSQIQNLLELLREFELAYHLGPKLSTAQLAKINKYFNQIIEQDL